MHSNHLAPSRDIALAFANYSRVRHLLSGGRHFFRDSKQSRKYLATFGPSLADPGNALSNSGNAGIWRQVSTGPHIHVLLNQHLSTASYVGPSVDPNPRFGTCKVDKQTERPYDSTVIAHYFPENNSSSFPQFPTLLSPLSSHSTYFTATTVTLLNGDVCHIADWVLFSLSAGNMEAPALGCIHEIVIDGAGVGTQQFPRPSAILLQQADIAERVEHYQMPRIRTSNNWAVVDIMVRGLLSEINTF